MRPFIFIVLYFAAGILVLAGCAKVNLENLESGSTPILFNSPVVGVHTKGDYDYPDVNFDVWAIFHTVDITGGLDVLDEEQDGYAYFSGLTFSKGANNYWSNSDAKWPKQTGAKLTFHAFSPASVEHLEHTWEDYGGGKTGFRITSDYTVATADLMYSDYAINKTSGNESEENDPTHLDGYTGVDILFHHALSKIRFKAKVDAVNANVNYVITDIKVKNYYKAGTFAENAPYDAFGSASPAWTINDASTNNEPASAVSIGTLKSHSDLSAAATELYTTAIGAGTGEMLVLPQYLVHNTDNYPDLNYDAEAKRVGVARTVSVEITYTEKIGSQNAQTVGPITVALGTDTDAWEPGKVYTYVITIAHSEIKLDPAVSLWTAPAGGDVNISGI